MHFYYLVIAGFYGLIFSLPDLIGDVRASALAKWWLERARESVELITKHGALVKKYLFVGGTILLLCVLIRSAWIPAWLFFSKALPAWFNTKKWWISFLDPVRLAGLFALILLGLQWLVMKGVESLLKKWLPHTAFRNKVADGSARLPVEVSLSNKLFGMMEAFSEFFRFWAIAPGPLIAGLVGSIFLIRNGFYDGMAEMSRWAFFISFLPLAIVGIVNAAIPIVLILGSVLRLVAFLVLIIPWVALLAPPLALNKLANLTGQPLFLKVGKYIAMALGVVMGFVLLKK